MRRAIRILLPMVVLGSSIVFARVLLTTAPEPQRTPPKQEIPLVEAVIMKPADYPVQLESRGNIAPHTQGELVAEIAGRITSISPNFKPGGWFESGEALITLDPTDYQYAVTIAMADLAQAELTLEKTKAEAEQAEANWRQMGLATKPTALTLHRPQLAQAEAALAAAKARLAQTRQDLDRTRIIAPYRGRLLEKRVDLGQFVTRGTPLATLYATDLAEVRLPITDRQARFLPLPETGNHPKVTLTTSTGGRIQSWQGIIVRSEATVDPRTQQLYVVAQINNPYTPREDGSVLKIGQFVTASIEGETLQQVYRIPRVAIRNGNEVLTIDQQERIQHRTIEPLWQQGDHLIVSSGLHPGERVVTTALPYAPDGMKVKASHRDSK